ncbi:MAG: DUF3718 domain-containing protein [Alteromonadaceae bacterium]|nr:DUF3718 domain-containing protein [Alteromonadaceae bacterium]
MKKLLLASTLSALTLSSFISLPEAQASNIGKRVCEYVAADDKKRMRSFLKMNKLKIRKLYKMVECSGQNLLVFAAKNGSVRTGTLMINKLPKRVVSENLVFLQSGSKALIDVANSRVSS